MRIPVSDMPKGSREFTDRCAAVAESFEDGTAGRVGEGGERAVDRLILNHGVHYSDETAILRRTPRVECLDEPAGAGRSAGT